MTKKQHLKHFIKLCKHHKAEYNKALMNAINSPDPMQVMKDADYEKIALPSRVAAVLVSTEGITVAEIKKAAWEGFNGLIEATCIEQNVQHILGLPVSKINVNDFVMIA